MLCVLHNFPKVFFFILGKWWSIFSITHCVQESRQTLPGKFLSAFSKTHTISQLDLNITSTGFETQAYIVWHPKEEGVMGLYWLATDYTLFLNIELRETKWG